MKKIIPMMIASSLIFTACSSHHKDPTPSEAAAAAAAAQPQVTSEQLAQTLTSWPEASKTAANKLTEKNGLPSAITGAGIIWTDTAPFKRSVVFKEEINHSFPMEHKDVLLQTIAYRVPLDKVASLAKFDGSLIIDRTAGELSARNETEEMNFLALNLADKIVRGELTPEKARREYSQNAESFQAGITNPMVSQLNFTTEGNTSDPDSMMQSQQSRPAKPAKALDSYEVKRVEETQEVIEESED